MSFISKSIKKAWSFTKDHWKEIALVAAIVFTAGVATVGFGAFAAAGYGTAGGMTFGGFMGAVGTTMWAGVAGAAGSVGLGAGATVPTTAATIASGTAGTSVGLGAAWGAGATLPGGSSLGWDASGKLAAASLEKGSAAAYQNAITSGLSKEAARKEAANYATKFTTDAAGNLTKAGAKAVAQKGAGNTGLEVVKAWGPTVAATVGPALVGLADTEPDPDGAAIWGSYAGGERAEARGRAAEANAVPGPDTPNEALPGGGTEAAGGLLNAQVNRPLQGNMGRRGYDGRPLGAEEEDDMGLMGRYGDYGYAT